MPQRFFPGRCGRSFCNGWPELLGVSIEIAIEIAIEIVPCADNGLALSNVTSACSETTQHCG